MTNYYKAVISNGEILTRRTEARKYSHAYYARGRYTNPGQGLPWCTTGWARSEPLAYKTMGANIRATGTAPSLAEVVPAIEISAAEYTKLRYTE